MEAFVGLVGRIIAFHALDMSLAGQKRASKTVEANDSLDEEAGCALVLMVSWKDGDRLTYLRRVCYPLLGRPPIRMCRDVDRQSLAAVRGSCKASEQSTQ